MTLFRGLLLFMMEDEHATSICSLLDLLIVVLNLLLHCHLLLLLEVRLRLNFLGQVIVRWDSAWAWLLVLTLSTVVELVVGSG